MASAAEGGSERKAVVARISQLKGAVLTTSLVLEGLSAEKALRSQNPRITSVVVDVFEDASLRAAAYAKCLFEKCEATSVLHTPPFSAFMPLLTHLRTEQKISKEVRGQV